MMRFKTAQADNYLKIKGHNTNGSGLGVCQTPPQTPMPGDANTTDFVDPHQCFVFAGVLILCN